MHRDKYYQSSSPLISLKKYEQVLIVKKNKKEVKALLQINSHLTLSWKLKLNVGFWSTQKNIAERELGTHFFSSIPCNRFYSSNFLFWWESSMPLPGSLPGSAFFFPPKMCPTQCLPNISEGRPIICSNSLCSGHMVTNALLGKNSSLEVNALWLDHWFGGRPSVYLCKSTRAVILYLPVLIFGSSVLLFLFQCERRLAKLLWVPIENKIFFSIHLSWYWHERIYSEPMKSSFTR